MPAFKYRAVGRSGVVDTGVITAVDLTAAQLQLRAKKLTPLSLTPAAAQKATPASAASADANVLDPKQLTGMLDKISSAPRSKRVKKRIERDDVLRFTNELAVLLKAGLPLDRAMRVQIDSAPPGPQQDLLSDLLEQLKGGKSLSAGFDKRPDVFSHFYINMVRSGEASGHLADVLAELAAYLERGGACGARRQMTSDQASTYSRWHCQEVAGLRGMRSSRPIELGRPWPSMDFGLVAGFG